jgi:hypothetical protein
VSSDALPPCKAVSTNGDTNFFQTFSDFSEIYFHFPLSYFYLLEGSKLFFMSSKYFIWIHHDPNRL